MGRRGEEPCSLSERGATVRRGSFDSEGRGSAEDATGDIATVSESDTEVGVEKKEVYHRTAVGVLGRLFWESRQEQFHTPNFIGIYIYYCISPCPCNGGRDAACPPIPLRVFLAYCWFPTFHQAGKAHLQWPLRGSQNLTRPIAPLCVLCSNMGDRRVAWVEPAGHTTP